MKTPICPSCGNTAMSWLKKLFALTLKCKSCGEKLNHDFLWSLITFIAFTLMAYFLINFVFGQWVVMPILLLAALVIAITPLKHKAQQK